MGIHKKFVMMMVFICLLGTSAIGAASYKLSEHNAIKEAKHKGEILFNHILATRQFFKNNQLPLIHELVAKDRFYPTLMSGFTVTRAIWDHFKSELSGYEFKQATLDPLHPPNKADSHELSLIGKFQARKDLKILEGVVDRGSKSFYYMAHPIGVDSKGCLRCHGNPADAPKDQIEIYGTENGYNWKLDDVVSTFIVYISIDEPLRAAKRTAIILFAAIGGSMLVALLIIGAIMDRTVVMPIVNLSARAEELSFGKDLAKRVDLPREDEVGELAKAIERLRNSLARLFRHQ